MKSVAQSRFTEISFQLLKETFEGPPATGGSAFLDKGGGLFQTVEQVTPQMASTEIRPGGPTIAAHIEHVRFYVGVHYKLMRGSTDAIDWEQSWRTRTVNLAEWDDLRRELRRAYSSLIEHFRAVDSWGEDEISVAMAIIAHTAYHLGAVRQLIRTLKSHP